MSRDEQEPTPASLDDVTAAVLELTAAMRANGLTRIDLEVGDVKIKLRSEAAKAVAATVVVAAETPVVAEVAAPPAEKPGHVVTAPMIGTFYHASGPGQPAFVRIGDRVEVGQTIGIIEAMKIMNEIAADRAGFVDEVIAANGQAVEYGSPLVRLSAAG